MLRGGGSKKIPTRRDDRISSSPVTEPLQRLSRRFANVFNNAIRQLAHLVWFVYLRRAYFKTASVIQLTLQNR